MPSNRPRIPQTKPAFLPDMDGILYPGNQVIPEAVTFLHAIRDYPHLFVTNNSPSTPAMLAEKLHDPGIPGEADQILTSAVATASCLRAQTPNFHHFAVGGIGLHVALAKHGRENAVDPDYVVIGEGEGLTYDSLPGDGALIAPFQAATGIK